MRHDRQIRWVWLALAALTVASAGFGQWSGHGVALAVVGALTMAIKGRLVIDHFLELNVANRRIRGLMRAYFYVVPGLTLLTYLYGDFLARVTTLR